MHEETVGSKIVKWVLIGVSVLFLVVMLLLPLATVISEALRDGWKTYQAAVTDKYTVKAVLLTLEATAIAVGVNTVFGVFAALAVTKYQFRGKKVLTTLIDVPVTISPIIAGLIFLLTFGRQSVIYPLLHDLGIHVVFAVPGIVLATIFVTFPFVSRELIPVLESQGTDEEEAAALIGANAWTIFRKVTFPISSGRCCTAWCCVQPEPWANSVRFRYCPDTCVAEPTPCRCTWKFCSMNFSMYRHLRLRRFWCLWQL